MGVLALQGAFAEHLAMLRRLGVEGREVRLPEDLEGLDALIMPGGESTTIGKLAVAYGLVEPIRPADPGGQAGVGHLRGHDPAGAATWARTSRCWAAWTWWWTATPSGGRWTASRSGSPCRCWAEPPFQSVFIRAPRIRSAGPGVEVLATLPDGKIVAARQDNMLVTAFHPELTDDDRWHRYFLSMISPAGG